MSRSLFALVALVLGVVGSLVAQTRIEYAPVRPEQQAHVSPELCGLAEDLATKEEYTLQSSMGTWSATVMETDPVVVPYDQARACIQIRSRDGSLRGVTIADFRTLRLEWVNDRLLYIFADIGHVAGVGQLLDVEESKWLYGRTEYYRESVPK